MKDYLTILAVLFFCIATPVCSLSQEEYTLSNDELSAHTINFGLNRGFLFTHHDFMDYYLQKKTFGIRLSVEKKLKGGWSKNFSYISRGIEVYRTSLGNNDILGHATHFVGFGNAGLHSKGKGKFKFGAGIGFLTHKFSVDKNYKNIVIGTTANAAIIFEYSYSFPIIKEYQMSPSIRFTHYSNGAYKLPNIGLNVVSAGVNIEKTIYNQSVSSHVGPASELTQRLQAVLTYGRNELNGNGSGQFGNSNLSFQYINTKHPKLIWGAGMDIHYSGAQKNHLIKNSDAGSVKNAFLESSRVGFSGIIGVSLGASELHINSGIYAIDQLHLDGSMYQRIYILTRLGKGFRIRFGLKSHITAAETIEIGISKNILAR